YTYTLVERFSCEASSTRRSAAPIFLFLNHTAPTETYTLSLHDALPICAEELARMLSGAQVTDLALRHARAMLREARKGEAARARSEEHTSELQSLAYLVCRLLLEKKKPKD